MPKSSPMSFKTRSRWTAEEGRAALAALASSGLSQRAFAAREGLDPQRLRLWRRRLGEQAAPSFVEVRARGIERVEIVLPSGVVLRVAETIDAFALGRLVGALAEAPC